MDIMGFLNAAVKVAGTVASVVNTVDKITSGGEEPRKSEVTQTPVVITAAEPIKPIKEEKVVNNITVNNFYIGKTDDYNLAQDISKCIRGIEYHDPVEMVRSKYSL